MECKFCGEEMTKVKEVIGYAFLEEEYRCPKCKSKLQIDNYIWEKHSERKVNYNWFTNTDGRG